MTKKFGLCNITAPVVSLTTALRASMSVLPFLCGTRLMTMSRVVAYVLSTAKLSGWRVSGTMISQRRVALQAMIEASASAVAPS